MKWHIMGSESGLVHHFRQRRMRKNTVHQVRTRSAQRQGDHEALHEFRDLGSNQMSAE
jgi:hypothetical protein